MTDIPTKNLPPAEWMPSCYMDEVVPPPRPSPQSWVVRLSDGTYALDGAGSDDEFCWLLQNGDTVNFEWTVRLDGKYEWTGSAWSPALPNVPNGAHEWMAAPEGFPILLSEAAQCLEPGDVIRPYCWSADSVRFEFRSGVLTETETQNVQ